MCYEPPDVFLIAGHSLGEVSSIIYPLLNAGSVPSSFFHKLSRC